MPSNISLPPHSYIVNLKTTVRYGKSGMYIGQVAEHTGLSRKAIRHYEALGLIQPKRQGTYRIYTSHHLDILDIIKQAQALGFKLSELKPLLEEKLLTQRFPVERAYHEIDNKQHELETQITHIQTQLQALSQLKKNLALLLKESPL